ncbi:EI24 domain-containing protein [Nioella aestuarii]|uniref:EI24 domain-containing protein n=1 Tax=Nioella aestuarii TaxID=1662864 RepID=UPI003D7FFCD2
MIFEDFLKAVRQLSDPRFLRVLLMGLALTVALLVGIYWVFATAIGWLVPDTIALPWIGEIGGIDAALSWAAIPVMLVASIFLMVPVASAFIGIFLDQIADAVEDRHYPNLPPARKVGLVEGLADSAKFLGVLIGVNLVALVAYILFAPIAPLLFWIVNGVLLGREYAQLVALRRLDAAGAATFRKRNRTQIFAAGVLMAVPLTIPVVNLLVPILGAATFTHLNHRLSRADRRTG